MVEGGVCLSSDATWLTLNPVLRLHASIYFSIKAESEGVQLEKGV